MAKRNTVILCGCRSCYFGMHNSEYGKAKMRNTVRKLRRYTKQLLKSNNYDAALDVIVSAGYLD
jgi:hypothetical protein